MKFKLEAQCRNKGSFPAGSAAFPSYSLTFWTFSLDLGAPLVPPGGVMTVLQVCVTLYLQPAFYSWYCSSTCSSGGPTRTASSFCSYSWGPGASLTASSSPRSSVSTASTASNQTVNKYPFKGDRQMKK